MCVINSDITSILTLSGDILKSDKMTMSNGFLNEKKINMKIYVYLQMKRAFVENGTCHVSDLHGEMMSNCIPSKDPIPEFKS